MIYLRQPLVDIISRIIVINIPLITQVIMYGDLIPVHSWQRRFIRCQFLYYIIVVYTTGHFFCIIINHLKIRLNYAWLFRSAKYYSHLKLPTLCSWRNHSTQNSFKLEPIIRSMPGIATATCVHVLFSEAYNRDPVWITDLNEERMK